MRNVLMGCVCLALVGSVAFAGEDANATKVVDKKIALPGGGEIHIRCESSGGGCGAGWGMQAGGGEGGFVGPIIVTAQAGDGNCPMAGGCGGPMGGQFMLGKPPMFMGKGPFMGKPDPNAAWVGLRVAPVRKPDPNAAWVGLRVAPVPAAVASQLGLKDKGVMVANIVKDSPAQKAGLERYDIITAVGKDEVRDVGKFIGAIQARKPGEKLELTVIRQGKKTEVTATTAKMDSSKVEMVYKDEEDDAWQEELKLHRGMVRRGPGGGWVIVTPEGGPVGLPPDILKALPKDLWSGMQAKMGANAEGKITFDVSKEVGDTRIEVKSAGDGGIEVTRTKIGKDGKEAEKSVKTYKNADELKAGDEQAYALYNETVGGGLRIQIGIGDGEPFALPLDGRSEKAEIEKRMKELAEKAKAAVALAAVEAERAAERARAETAETRAKLAKVIAPEPTAEFNVDADGRIAVSVREGDTAAKLTFKNEAELLEKAPRLYKRYMALLGKMMK